MVVLSVREVGAHEHQAKAFHVGVSHSCNLSFNSRVGMEFEWGFTQSRKVRRAIIYSRRLRLVVNCLLSYFATEIRVFIRADSSRYSCSGTIALPQIRA